MKILISRPYKEDYKNILLDYYNSVELENGKTPFSDSTKKLILEGNISNITEDSNFILAYDLFNKILNSYDVTYYGLYTDENLLIAHTNCSLVVDNQGSWDACIDKIYIDNDETFKKTYIYNNLFSTIINDIKRKFISINEINIVFKEIDPTMESILEINNYEESTSLKNSYIKNVRKREKY